MCLRDLAEKAVLIRRALPASSECDGPQNGACFSIEPTELPSFAYKTITGAINETDSRLFADSMATRQIDFVDQTGNCWRIIGPTTTFLMDALARSRAC